MTKTKVAVIVADNTVGMEPRIKAELESVGFLVPVISIKSELSHRDLMQHCRNLGAVAAVRCVGSGEYVEIWIADRITNKVILRTVKIPAGEKDSDDIVAFAVVELLRASLLETGTNHKMEGEILSDDNVKNLVKPRKGETLFSKPEKQHAKILSIEFEPIVLFANFQSPSVMFDLMIGLNCKLSGLFSLSAFGAIPIISDYQKEKEGDIQTRFSFAGTGLRLSFLKSEKTINASVEFGFSVLFFNVEGRPSSGYKANEDTLTVYAPYLRLSASVRLSPAWAVILDVISGITPKSVQVDMAGRRAANYGKPFAGIGLGAEFTLY